MPFVTALVALDEDPAVRLCTYVVDAEPEDLVADAPVAVSFRPLEFTTVPGRSVVVPMFALVVIYDDLRVVDCTTGIAGAYCAKLLTDLGADVVFGDARSATTRCSRICAPRSATPPISRRGSRPPTS